MTLIHAFALLPNPIQEIPDVVALFGTDATLRCWSMQSLTSLGDVTQFEGDTTRWSDLRDDLATASLFDLGAKRTIVVRSADKFVSNHRGEIESFIARPSTAARLILEFDSLASNTRIYKGILQNHLLIACGSATDVKLGVTAASRRKFLTGYVAKKHGTKLSHEAADVLLEMLGDEIGMLDTEIAKLALYTESGAAIDEALVRDVVAGWQGKTVWQITDAIAAGDAAEALRQLDKLMSGGQRPIALLPQIAWSLRRLGLATAVVESMERSGRQPRLSEALAAAGVAPSRRNRARDQSIEGAAAAPRQSVVALVARRRFETQGNPQRRRPRSIPVGTIGDAVGEIDTLKRILPLSSIDRWPLTLAQSMMSQTPAEAAGE